MRLARGRRLPLNDAGAAAGVRPAWEMARRFEEGRWRRGSFAAAPTGHAQSEGIMDENDPRTSFRGLPLTAEQDSEIRHYIHVRMRNGLPWDTPELQAMLDDMLHPPESMEEDGQALADSVGAQGLQAQDDGGDFIPHRQHQDGHAS